MVCFIMGFLKLFRYAVSYVLVDIHTQKLVDEIFIAKQNPYITTDELRVLNGDSEMVKSKLKVNEIKYDFCIMCRNAKYLVLNT